MKTAQEMIDGAIEEIHEHGWCRNSLRTAEGRLCVMGALYAASGVRYARSDKRRLDDDLTYDPTGVGWRLRYPADWMWSPFSDACQAVERVVDGLDVPTWNDGVARDADHVIEILKLAREELESGV